MSNKIYGIPIATPINPGKFGGSGAGADGGYYTPKVSQVNENTMRVSFFASGDKMPPVQSADITLPAGKNGKDGSDYVLTEADKEEIASMLETNTYTKAEIDAVLGSYITDIDTLVGGDS